MSSVKACDKKFLLILFFLCFITLHGQKKKIDSLENILKSTTVDTVKVKVLSKLTDLYSRSGAFNDAIRSGESALALAKKIEFKRMMPHIYNVIGNAYTNHSDYPKALEYLQEALKLSVANNDAKGISAAGNNIAIIYYSFADYNKALEYFQKALKIEESLGDQYRIAAFYGNIAVVYELLGDDSLSMEFQLKSFRIHEKMNTRPDMAASLSHLALLHRKKKDYTKALECQKRSLSIADEVGQKEGIAEAHGSMGNLLMEMNSLPEALSELQTSLKALEEIGEKKLQSDALISIAKIYKMLGNKSLALMNYEKALSLAELIGSKEEQKNASEGLYEIYKSENNLKEALRYFEKATMLKDSILNVSKNEGFNNLKTQFALDRQEHELNTKSAEDLRKKEDEKKQQRFIIYAAIAVLCVTLLFSYFLFKRFKITREQKKIIESQKELVELKNKETTDSIRYAKGIQQTLLANDDLLNTNLGSYFVFYKPKDIVSGDFYWASSDKNTERSADFYLAVCDCTGHGVPGAFMSLLNISFLNEAINEKKIKDPSGILNHVRKRLIESISSSLNNNMAGKDGMDGILLRVEKEGRGIKSISYSAANNAPVVISDKQIIELPKDKMPVGQGESDLDFKTYEINAKKGDMLYLYTDGFADQFGGKDGKKFKRKQLNELLSNISEEPLERQKKMLFDTFENWRNGLEQVDDVCIFGLRI